MKTYQVIVPIAGAYCITVEAENQEEAEDKALDAFPLNVTVLPEYNAELLELEAYDNIVDGNVSSITYESIEVEELD